jgi:flavin reductase (DIM6/NTAB) family NADH-FMN oxidoreductase RutF
MERRGMVQKTTIAIKDFLVKPHDIWNNKWFLLTAGDFEKTDYNTMTVAWGSFGTMWHKPFAQVVVRPTRYTFEFMEKYDSFTLTAFPKEYKKALSFLGSRSGRDMDKIAESGLTPCKSSIVAAPSFEEAELVVECKKMYWQDFTPENFDDPSLDKNYPKKDYHRSYFGEIVTVLKSE